MSYKLYDLSNPFGIMTPLWPIIGRQDITLQRVMFHGVGYAGGVSKRATIYHGSLHHGTHVDAPIHAVDGGITMDKIPLENCYGTGVIVDFRHMKKWHKVTAEDFENAKPKIQPGDFVVCNTGWHKWWRVKDYVYFNHYPGLVESGAEWLVKKKIKAIAGDWAANDHPVAHAPLQQTMPWLYDEYKKETGKDPDKEFPIYEPCHTILLSNGITSIEAAGGDMDLVTGKRCTLAAFPFRLEEGDGGMVRLVAIVEE